jgi:hypothetical protein
MSRVDKHYEALRTFLLGAAETHTQTLLCSQLQPFHLPCAPPLRCACLVIPAFQDCVSGSAHVQLRRYVDGLDLKLGWSALEPSPPSSVNHKLGVVCF